MKIKRIVLLSVCSVVSMMAHNDAAYAFDDAAVRNIAENYSPDYAALGIRLGSWTALPQLAYEYRYDDNIFREARDYKSDTISVYTPSLLIRSDWNVHAVQLGGRAEVARYKDFDDENYADHRYFISTRLDLARETSLTIGASQIFGHESRASLDDAGSDEPITFDTTIYRADFKRELGIFKFYLDGQIYNIAYDNGELQGVAVDNGDRDRMQSITRGRLAYSVTDNSAVYVETAMNTRDYDRDSVSFRDSVGYEHVVGAMVNFSGKLKSDVYAGYITQDYDGDFEDISGHNIGGSVLWNMSALTSIEADLSRRIAETTLAGASGISRWAAGLKLDHAFRENMTMSVLGSWQDDAYEGTLATLSQSDNTLYDFGIEAQYKLNSRAALALDYEYTTRFFEGANRDYDNSRVGLRLTVAY